MNKELEDSVQLRVTDKNNRNQINAYCAKDVFKSYVKDKQLPLTFKHSSSKKYIEVAFIDGNVKYSTLLTKREVSANFGKVEVIE